MFLQKPDWTRELHKRALHMQNIKSTRQIFCWKYILLSPADDFTVGKTSNNDVETATKSTAWLIDNDKQQSLVYVIFHSMIPVSISKRNSNKHNEFSQ